MPSPSKYSLRLPASLKTAVEAVARQKGTTLNQFIVSAVAEKLSALTTADYFSERAARGDIDAALRILSRPKANRRDRVMNWPPVTALPNRPDGAGAVRIYPRL